MIRKLLPLTLIGLLAAAMTSTAFADEASVKKAIEAKLGNKVDSVTKMPYLGLYEVYTDGQIVYTDEKQTTLLIGTLIDGKTMKNVTAERMQKLTAIRFNDLPIERAVKIVRGDGKRVFATFEDPNCGYCKRLAKETAKLDNATIYVFLFPILSPDSLEKSKQIWCSADRGKAWTEWMVDGKAPVAKGDCDVSAIQKNLELGHKLAINGTPTIFFTDGERIPGAVPIAKIEQKLGQTAPR
ncbi:DsbC family protein [Rhodocyclus tenuis]|uniref:Thiol:disulfide interchange protein n=1 Tax=Rhodocyclus gracilis TaxID=2929842 RepID=A0ABX0WKN1_9RHOO|nr:DsbC family protein [Rhodocyclus gracilis]MRD72446.1 thioredoxin fold domain-containing protein [Rhodocyclus gracilis]NJA89468.1 DsbC family protein [Rhodocyclus gracilis]